MDSKFRKITQKNKLLAASLIAFTIFSASLVAAIPIVPDAGAANLTGSSTANTLSRSPFGITPFGPMDVAQVSHYNGTVIDADAILAKLGVNPDFHAPPADGWNEYAYWTASTAPTQFTGKWIVPSTPTSSYTCNSSQVTYLFNSLTGGNTIIQPVLQYGYNGIYAGCGWQLVSWMYVGSNPPISSYSTPISVNPGDVIYGSMSKSNGIWTITSQDVTTGTSTTLQVSTSANLLKSTVTLETYDLPTQCGYLPGNIYWYDLQINGGSTTPSWSTASPSTWCNMSMQIPSSSSTDMYMHTLDTGGVWVFAKEQSTGEHIDGLSFGVYDSNNQLIQSGYSPQYVPISSTGTYNIKYNDYGNYYFTNTPTTSNYNVYDWGGHITTISLSNASDTYVDGVYYNHDNPGNYAKVTYQSQYTTGSALTGMYGGFKDSSGAIWSQGYTPYTVGLPINQNLTVIWNNYGSTYYQYADTTATETSDNKYSWGGQQVISASVAGSSYNDTGKFSNTP